MNDQAAHFAKDWLTLLLTGLGITFLPHQWIGGMFLALAGASLARSLEPEQDRRELWAVMVAAFFTSHLAAILAYRWMPDFPVQIVMAATGFASRRLTRMAMKIMGLIEARSDTIADRVIDRVLPPSPKPPKETEE